MSVPITPSTRARSASSMPGRSTSICERWRCGSTRCLWHVTARPDGMGAVPPPCELPPNRRSLRFGVDRIKSCSASLW